MLKVSVHQLRMFVAGLLEEGPELDQIRADLESPDSPVSQYLAEVARKTKGMLDVNWANILRESMDYNALVACIGGQVLFPMDLRARLMLYWYVCGRQHFEKAGEVALTFSPTERETLVANLLALYTAELRAIEAQIEPMSRDDAEYHELLLEPITELGERYPNVRASTWSEAVAQMDLPVVIDVFFQWDEQWNETWPAWERSIPLRRLRAFVYVGTDFLFSADEIEGHWRNLLVAIRGCLT